MDPRYEVLDDAARLAREFVEGLPTRPVASQTNLEELRAKFARPLTDAGENPRTVIAELARDAEPGLIASPGPRYFGYVIGGALPVTVAADWLTSTWDQNSGLFATAPSVSVIEEVAATWIRDLLGLPIDCGIGFVTGCEMAHLTCLAAARHSVLERVGWSVEADGLQGAPEVRVIAGESSHVTVSVACRFLGLGSSRINLIECDDQGRMKAGELERVLAEYDGPTIVCAQAGDVNAGCFDPLDEIVAACREHGVWCHVDGAFGLWAAASPSRRELLRGYERADSWAMDGHKWLNVPYDCGIAAVADASAHRAAMTSSAAYLPAKTDDVPSGLDWAPEFSRRGRGVTVYAALRSLGREGVADLVDRCCDHAARFARELETEEGVEVLNEVVLNQVLVRFGDDDEVTNAVLARVHDGGVCWMSGSTFGGRAVMRISVVNWQTTAEDIDESAKSVLAAFASVRAG